MAPPISGSHETHIFFCDSVNELMLIHGNRFSNPEILRNFSRQCAPELVRLAIKCRVCGRHFQTPAGPTVAFVMKMNLVYILIRRRASAAIEQITSATLVIIVHLSPYLETAFKIKKYVVYNKPQAILASMRSVCIVLSVHPPGINPGIIDDAKDIIWKLRAGKLIAA